MKRLFIDPTYIDYEGNKLFDQQDSRLNRDGALLPYINFRREMADLQIEVLTYDQISNFSVEEVRGDGYISLGIVRNWEELRQKGLVLMAYYLLEPPLILPKAYLQIENLVHFFEKVFIHNTRGDCYALPREHCDRLAPMYWPQPYDDVVAPYWSNKERERAVVLINGHHCPRRFLSKELYSKRIIWAVGLSRWIKVDLYGRGWNQLWSKKSLLPSYLFNYFRLMKIYKGMVDSKLEVMSKYDFALCFENMIMDGYITEKIFDCFYAGVIPIYRGGNDIQTRIPSNCYIDLRNFKDAQDLSTFLLKMTASEKEEYRLAAKEFLRSVEGQKFSHMGIQLELKP